VARERQQGKDLGEKVRGWELRREERRLRVGEELRSLEEESGVPGGMRYVSEYEKKLNSSWFQKLF